MIEESNSPGRVTNPALSMWEKSDNKSLAANLQAWPHSAHLWKNLYLLRNLNGKFRKKPRSVPFKS